MIHFISVAIVYDLSTFLIRLCKIDDNIAWSNFEDCFITF